MSKILRQTSMAPTIFIGDHDFDFRKEESAEHILNQLFPTVSIITTPDGKKQIPLSEMSKVKETMDKVMSGSWERGRNEGYKQGLKEGLTESEKVLREFDSLVKSATVERKRLYEDAKSNILSLVTKLSKKITFDAVNVDPEKTVKIIAGVIDTLIDKTVLKLKVNPDHLPIIEQNIDKFLKQDSSIKEIKIEADPRVKYGGCLIETPTGDVDARIESQFEIVDQTLANGDA